VAHRLQVKTVAEHVHSRDLYERLLMLGVDCIQGDYIGMPVPIAELFQPQAGAQPAASSAPKPAMAPGVLSAL